MNGEQSKFTSFQLEAALLSSYDLMTRGLTQLNYIVVGDVAECIKHNRPLRGDGIDCVLERKYVTKAVVDMIKVWATPEVTEKGFTYTVQEVPVRFRFIDNSYDFLRFADFKVYGAEQYKIPNPLGEYDKYKGRII